MIAEKRPACLRTWPHGFSFTTKAASVAALIILADTLFFRERVGTTLGVFCLTWLSLILCCQRLLIRHRGARVAAGVATVAGLALIYDPSLLAAVLFWCALSLGVLFSRSGIFDNAWRWIKRLAFHAVLTVPAPLLDFVRVLRARRHRGTVRLLPQLPVLALPVLGTCVFVALFAVANPLIGNALHAIDLWRLIDAISIVRIAFWTAVAICVWNSFRPRPIRMADFNGTEIDIRLPGASVASVRLSLVAFNTVFLVQNSLDAAILWGGAELPPGVTLAEYAHRGAYPLIATALLAGLFVLLTLKPGSATAQSPLLRQLVYFWIAQNVFLVASSILRTLDYIEAYSLTRLRIAALLWMVLVAIGLVLLCWRIWRSKSGAWLINANALAATAVLMSCSFIDLGAIAANWNVRHAREAGGRGAALDLCYLRQLGPSALVPLVELEVARLDPILQDRLSAVRTATFQSLVRGQQDWHGWIWRNAQRLKTANALLAKNRLSDADTDRRRCDGRRIAPPPPDNPPVPPLKTLTAAPVR